MKCNNCGKRFNTFAFGETHCPYCGTKVNENMKKKIENYKYFENRWGLILLILSPFILSLLFMIIYFLKSLF